MLYYSVVIYCINAAKAKVKVKVTGRLREDHYVVIATKGRDSSEYLVEKTLPCYTIVTSFVWQ